MKFIKTQAGDGVINIVIKRGKVNALNREIVEELYTTLLETEKNTKVNSVIITGHRSFFSFGFDIPEFLPLSKLEFEEYLIRFTTLYTYMFMYPKPIVAAINGHAIAGGCMLALACDRRVMVSEKAKISLNEISFGATILAGSTEMLRYCVGSSAASEILYSGKMYAADDAQRLGLVDVVVPDQDLMNEATLIANQLGDKPSTAFSDIKRLLREPILSEIKLREEESIRRFISIWYSKETRMKLRNIKIY